MEAADKTVYNSYYDAYSLGISENLKKIDLMMKSGKNINRAELAEAIGISAEELKAILSSHKIKRLDKAALTVILHEGTGEICKLYRRELERGLPLVYTREDIAYIYDLDISKINKACECLGVLEGTSQIIPFIFRQLPAKGVKAL